MSKCWILFLSRSVAFQCAVLWWRARDFRSKYSYTAAIGRKQKQTCRDRHLLLPVATSTTISIISEYTHHSRIIYKLSIICPCSLYPFSPIRLFKNCSGSLLSWHKNMMILSFARYILAMSLVSVFWTETMPTGFLTATVVAVTWAWTDGLPWAEHPCGLSGFAPHGGRIPVLL